MKRLLIPVFVALLAAALPILSQQPRTEQVTPYTVRFADEPKAKAEVIGGVILDSTKREKLGPGTEAFAFDDEKPLPKDPVKSEKPKYARGHKPLTAEQSAKMHAERKAILGNHVEKLPKATAPAWDCRTLGMVLPGNDQGQCGDCFGVSTADAASMALIMAGILPNDTSKGRLSSQYGLDNRDAFQGGCNGGNGTQVIDYMIKSGGWPLTSDYGPYTASPGRLKPLTGMKLYKPVQWGYCTPGQEGGMASVQDIKNCMVKYGVINISFDASGCDSYTWPNVMKGRGNSVDHEVCCVGWDDSKNAFLGMNQWGDSWGGPGGVFWIDYGSYSWGTDAFWVLGSNGPPPPPPPPPPGPTPGTATTLPSGTYTVSTDAAGVIIFTPAAAVNKDTTLGQIASLLNPPPAQPKTPEEILDALRKLLTPKP